MQYVLIVQSEYLARKDAPPFIPEVMIMEGLYGVAVFGPYPTIEIASSKIRQFPSSWGNLKVVPLQATLKEVENPYLFLQELRVYEREDRI
jgi:hypothetical protein